VTHPCVGRRAACLFPVLNAPFPSTIFYSITFYSLESVYYRHHNCKLLDPHVWASCIPGYTGTSQGCGNFFKRIFIHYSFCYFYIIFLYLDDSSLLLTGPVDAARDQLFHRQQTSLKTSLLLVPLQATFSGLSSLTH